MKKVILTENAPAPIGPYSQGLRAGDTLYISGQVAFIPPTDQIMLDSIEAETHQVMKNIGAILKEAGLGYDNVVSTTIFLMDMNNFSRVNAVYGEYFKDGKFPARATVQVAGLPRKVNVEISAIAHF